MKFQAIRCKVFICQPFLTVIFLLVQIVQLFLRFYQFVVKYIYPSKVSSLFWKYGPRSTYIKYSLILIYNLSKKYFLDNTRASFKWEIAGSFYDVFFLFWNAHWKFFANFYTLKSLALIGIFKIQIDVSTVNVMSMVNTIVAPEIKYKLGQSIWNFCTYLSIENKPNRIKETSAMRCELRHLWLQKEKIIYSVITRKLRQMKLWKFALILY